MPELPEVETTVRGINEKAKGLRIISIWSDVPLMVQGMKFEDFSRETERRKIEFAERRGKNILIHLSGDKILRIHMKMTGHIMYGKWIFQNGKWEAVSPETLKDNRNEFIHFIFGLSDGNELALSDMRKFARIDFYNKGDPPKDLLNLGPEPMEKDFTYEKFSDAISILPKRKIKQALMDQNTIAGIGNIYSDEILWTAGVHPLSAVGKIPPEKMRDIFSAIKKVFEKSISLGGDSVSDYRNIDGEKGRYQEHHLVYRRTGEICPHSSGDELVKRIEVGGRGTHFCPKHQIRYN